MLFGESAGAISVCYHLAAPKSANLFRAALMESGLCDVYSLEKGLGFGNAIVTVCIILTTVT
jgi:para-nitrobenzyl esterase